MKKQKTWVFQKGKVVFLMNAAEVQNPFNNNHTLLLDDSFYNFILSWALWFFQQYFSHIMAVSFIGGGNRSTRRKLPTCLKSLTNFIT
jgi:hypothetical protein